MKFKRIVIFKCLICGHQYNDIESAEICCPNYEVIERWICSICGKFYKDKEEALKCCEVETEREIFDYTKIGQLPIYKKGLDDD